MTDNADRLTLRCSSCENYLNAGEEKVPDGSLMRLAQDKGWMLYTRRELFCPECLWKRQNPGAEDFTATGVELAQRMQQFIGYPVSKVILAGIQHVIDDTFNTAVAYRKYLLAAEGMQVVGATPVDAFGPPRSGAVFVLEYKTQFYPFSRFAEVPEKHVALGFHKEYQLYLADQGELPPTVVARYGPDGEYLTYNPILQGLEGMSLAGEPFAVALQRLTFWRADFEHWVRAQQ